MTEPSGPLAEEAARLLEALQRWVADHLGGLGAASAGVASASAGPAAKCQLCPVCQLLSLLRGSRPEVFEHLADASTSLVAAVRAAADAPGRSSTPAARTTVQRIHVG